MPGNGNDVEPNEGDHVHVVLDGIVESANDAYLTIGTSNQVQLGSEELVSIKVVEPPVTTFEPGQTIRSRENGGKTLTLLEAPPHHRGYVNADTGLVTWTNMAFTSKNYELLVCDVP